MDRHVELVKRWCDKPYSESIDARNTNLISAMNLQSLAGTSTFQGDVTKAIVEIAECAVDNKWIEACHLVYVYEQKENKRLAARKRELVSSQELAKLQYDSNLLKCLHEAGVEGWFGYAEAFNKFKEEKL